MDLSETLFCLLHVSLYLLFFFALEIEACWDVFLMKDSLTVWGGFSSSFVSATFWIPIDESPCSVSFTNLNEKHHETTLLKGPVLMSLINQTSPVTKIPPQSYSLYTINFNTLMWEGGLFCFPVSMAKIFITGLEIFSYEYFILV